MKHARRYLITIAALCSGLFFATTDSQAQQKPPALCGGKAAPVSRDPLITLEYSCICNEWRLSARTTKRKSPPPCNEPYTSSESWRYVELRSSEKEGGKSVAKCRGVESFYSSTSTTPKVMKATSCTPKGGTPRVIPSQCVTPSNTTEVKSEYELCKNSQARSHSLRRTTTTSSLTEVLNCAAGEWVYEKKGVSFTCEWNCNGEQMNPSCPKEESEVYD